ncbi:pentatricopeptide repeat-containing protein, mitochondrial [Trifolium repens]|nr:pentatricopeptide repeat-containing protein, mitochondrial [Trifolium repens]
MSLKLKLPVSYRAAATATILPTISHETIHHHNQQPKPKHPQHFLSLLLNNSSNNQSLQQLHSQIITSSLFHHYPFHNNSTSLLLFNNLIRSYSLSPFPHQALQFFSYTLNSLTHPLSLDSFTLTFVSHTCANLNSTHFGFHLHCVVFKLGFHSHVFVQTGLLHMYSSWGLLVSAAQVFGEMPERNVVSWNVFISGLIKWGQLEFARSVFDKMVVRSVVSWTLVIDGYIKMCQSVHGYVEKRGFNAVDIRIVNALIDLYAKCGCIESASRFFWEMPDWRKNLVSWNSVISGYAIFGMVAEAVETFEKMEKAGVRPNHVAFLSVLSACSHGGLVEEGLEFFGKMVNDYGLMPDVKHYGCVIDMLGRAGRLEEAEKVALQVPREVANDVIWRTLLGACSVHDNVEIG